MLTIQQAAQMAPPQRAQILMQAENLIKKNKRNGDALLSAAAIHQVEGRVDLVAQLLKNANKAEPKNSMILAWLAIALLETGALSEAKAVSLKLVQLEPESVSAWEGRGRVLEKTGNMDDALIAFEKADQLAGGENAELKLKIANCNFYTGEVETARQNYLDAIKLAPDHPVALYGYSTIHKFSDQDVDRFIEQTDKALDTAKGNRPGYQLSMLRYAAAKALTDCKRYDEAFERYSKANAAHAPVDAPRLERSFENARAAFTKAFFNDKKDWGERASAPIFVLGMPRSGTTLIENAIGAHKFITAGGEMSFISEFAEPLGAMTAEPEEYKANIAGLSRNDIARFTQNYIRKGRIMAGTSARFTDKMPHNFMHIGLILLLFPKAKIIHCNRNPLDCCVSIFTNPMTAMHNLYKSDLTTLGGYYRHYLELADYWREIFPGRIFDIYYEDMTQNPDYCTKQLIEFVGLEWNQKLLAGDNAKTTVKTLSAFQVRQPVYTSSVGKWQRYKNHLTPLIEALGDAPQAYEAKLAALTENTAQ